MVANTLQARCPRYYVSTIENKYLVFTFEIAKYRKNLISVICEISGQTKR